MDQITEAPKQTGHYRRTCPECGQFFGTDTHDRLFCSDAHKAAFHNRSSKVGRSMVPLAMAWRAGRNAKGRTPEARAIRASASRAFAEMCAILDREAADDRANGRTDKLDYVRSRRRMSGDVMPQETAEFHKAADERAAKTKPVPGGTPAV